MRFKSLKPRILLSTYIIAAILHALFHCMPIGNHGLFIIESLAILATFIVTTIGITILAVDGLNRTRWAYLIFLCIFAISRLLLIIQYWLQTEPIVIFNHINAPLMLYSAILAFIFILYPIELLRPHYFNPKRTAVIALPIVIYTILIYALSSSSWTSCTLTTLGYFIVTLYPLSTLIFALKIQKKHHQWCLNNYSNLENASDSWIKYYLWAYLALHVSFSYIYFTGALDATIVQTILLGLFITLTLPFVIRQKALEPAEIVELIALSEETEVSEEEHTEIREGHEPDINHIAEIYKEKLLNYMLQDKPYLNSDLRLTDLCETLHINRTYMSRLFNETFNEKFYDFIARYRIEYSKQLIANNPNIKIAQVAQDSGFNSPAVYGRTFIKAEGMTPKAYQQKIRNKANETGTLSS